MLSVSAESADCCLLVVFLQLLYGCWLFFPSWLLVVLRVSLKGRCHSQLSQLTVVCWLFFSSGLLFVGCIASVGCWLLAVMLVESQS